MTLRRWEYNFSKEAKSSPHVEEKSSGLINHSIASSIETKKTQSTSTVKIFSLIYKIETEGCSPPPSWNNALLDTALNKLFDVYYEALKIGSLDSLEPLDKAIAKNVAAVVDDYCKSHEAFILAEHSNPCKKTSHLIATFTEETTEITVSQVSVRPTPR